MTENPKLRASHPSVVFLTSPHPECRESFANPPASLSAMFQLEPLRQKFPYQVTPLSPSLHCAPNSARRVGEVVTVSASRGLPRPCLPGGGGAAGVLFPAQRLSGMGLGRGVQGARSPGSRSPGPAGCAQGPAPATSAQHLLCTDPEKLSLAFMAADLGRRSRVPWLALHGAKTLLLHFPPLHTPPTLPVCSQLCEAGTDVQPAPLPLPRGRWPREPREPSRVPMLCSPGDTGRDLGAQVREPRSHHSTPGTLGALWPPCAFAPCPPGNPHFAADTRRMNRRPRRGALRTRAPPLCRSNSLAPGRGLCSAWG